MDLGKPETGHQMTTVPVPFVVQTKPPSVLVLDTYKHSSQNIIVKRFLRTVVKLFDILLMSENSFLQA
jgi:hypothetical protein